MVLVAGVGGAGGGSAGTAGTVCVAAIGSVVGGVLPALLPRPTDSSRTCWTVGCLLLNSHHSLLPLHIRHWLFAKP